MKSNLTPGREPRPGDVVQSDPDAPSSAAGAQHPGTQSPTDAEGNAQPAKQRQLEGDDDDQAGGDPAGAGADPNAPHHGGGSY